METRKMKMKLNEVKLNELPDDIQNDYRFIKNHMKATVIMLRQEADKIDNLFTKLEEGELDIDTDVIYDATLKYVHNLLNLSGELSSLGLDNLLIVSIGLEGKISRATKAKATITLTKPGKKFVLVKYPNKNLVLQVVGGYTTEKEREIIQSAGWIAGDYNLPRLTDKQLEESPYLETESFHAPTGSDIFGGHTSEEAKQWRNVIREKFAAAGMILYFRKGDLNELI